MRKLTLFLVLIMSLQLTAWSPLPNTLVCRPHRAICASPNTSPALMPVACDETDWEDCKNMCRDRQDACLRVCGSNELYASRSMCESNCLANQIACFDMCQETSCSSDEK